MSNESGTSRRVYSYIVFCVHGLNFRVSQSSVSSRNICDVGTTTRIAAPFDDFSDHTATVWFGYGQNSPTPFTPSRSTRNAYSAESSSHSAVAVGASSDGFRTLPTAATRCPNSAVCS